MRLLILRVIVFRQGLLPGISNHLQTETNPFRKGTDRKSVVEDALGPVQTPLHSCAEIQVRLWSDIGATTDSDGVLCVEPISCGYTCLLSKVTLWVIALGWDRFGFPVRFSPPVTCK